MTAHRLLIGSYGPADQDTIHLAELASSQLRLVGSASGITNPSFLAVAPRRGRVYAVSETSTDGDGVGGHVHELAGLVTANRRASGGDLPCHLALDASERWLAVSNYGSGSVAILPIGADGELGEIVSLVEHEGSGPNPARQRGPHAHCSVFTPDGRFLIAADLGADAIVVHAFDDRSGALRQHRVIRAEPGSGPRHLAFHPSGSHLFAVAELANRVVVYRWDGDAGDLIPVTSVSSRVSDRGENLAADLHVAADGRVVYVSNRGDDTVAVVGFDGVGRLDVLAVRPSGGSWPRGFAISPDARHLVAANQESDEVAVLPLVAPGDDVAPPVGRVRVRQPTCVAFWPS